MLSWLTRMRCTLLFPALLAATPIGGQAETPLVDIARCKFEPAAWRAMHDAIKGNGAKAWKQVASANSDLTLYELPAPITIAGHQTSMIALMEDGLFAVLDTADRAALAVELGIDPETASPYAVAVTVPGETYQSAGDIGGSFLASREAYNRTGSAAEGGLPHVSRAVQTVFDRDTDPAKTFIGCSYGFMFDASGAEAVEADPNEAARPAP